jgi:hypothetical protein
VLIVAPLLVPAIGPLRLVKWTQTYWSMPVLRANDVHCQHLEGAEPYFAGRASKAEATRTPPHLRTLEVLSGFLHRRGTKPHD